MLILKEHHAARRLRVEGAGNVQDGVVDELLDLVIADWCLLVQGIESTPALDRVYERF